MHMYKDLLTEPNRRNEEESFEKKSLFLFFLIFSIR